MTAEDAQDNPAEEAPEGRPVDGPPDGSADRAGLDDLLASAAATPPVPAPDAVERIATAARAAAAEVLDQAEAVGERNPGAATDVEPGGRRRGQRFVQITGAQVAAWRDGQADPAVAAAIERALRLGDPRVLALQAQLEEADRVLARADVPTPSPSVARRLRVAAMDAAREHLDATSTRAPDPSLEPTTTEPPPSAGGLRARLAEWFGSGGALRLAGGLATVAVVAVVGLQVLPQGASEMELSSAGSDDVVEESAAAPELAASPRAVEPEAGDVRAFDAATDAAEPMRDVDLTGRALVRLAQTAPIAGSVEQVVVGRLDMPLSADQVSKRAYDIGLRSLGPTDGDDPGPTTPAALTGDEREAVRACLDAFVPRQDRVERVVLANDEAGATTTVVVLFPARMLVVDVSDCG